MTEEQLGFDKVPDRYSKTGRETIDKIRDSMSDEQFIMFCYGQAIRYRDRAGLKGPEEVDMRKADFYVKMALHVQGEELDPRGYRSNHQPYERQSYNHQEHFKEGEWKWAK